MKYGFCTGFASSPLFSVEISMPVIVKEFGFDFIEFPVTGINALSEEKFSDVVALVRELGLESNIMCNFFPGNLNLFRDNRDRIADYVKSALNRAKALGVSKIIFGSGAFRNPPPELDTDCAVRRFVDFIKTVLCPLAHETDIRILLEPLNKSECALVNSLKEGSAVVNLVEDRQFGLMADLYHMMTENESIEDLKFLFPLVEHIHIANTARALPAESLDTYILRCLKLIAELGYDKTISLETAALHGADKALGFLKSLF
ncbi:sugar phosphate isomerase/epimerase [Treponema sp. OMZ 840]|uniref:sugar phosphate isomerase/epimerase family protein n=1 Tax=Treponema sp. OMZ 840 TaxID=244313 RepID=UPI003D8CEE60